MPTSRFIYGLRADYIELIHDRGIELAFPDVEPVHANDCLDYNLLRSATEQPFQGGFGVEYYYPTLLDKAACLFFSIAGGHIFSNGNNRTAVIAIDQFCYANRMYLLLSNPEIYDLAVQTASFRERNESDDVARRRILDAISTYTIDFHRIRLVDQKLYRRLHKIKATLRHPDCTTPYPSN